MSCDKKISRQERKGKAKDETKEPKTIAGVAYPLCQLLEKRFTAKFVKEAQRTQGKLGSSEILDHIKQIILPCITKGHECS